MVSDVLSGVPSCSISYWTPTQRSLRTLFTCCCSRSPASLLLGGARCLRIRLGSIIIGVGPILAELLPISLMPHAFLNRNFVIAIRPGHCHLIGAFGVRIGQLTGFVLEILRCTVDVL